MKLYLHRQITCLSIVTLLVFGFALESLAQSKVIAEFTDSDGASFNRAVLSRDGSMIAASTNRKTIVWDFATREIINSYAGIPQAVGLDFSPDGQYMASGGISLQADVWDIKTGEAVLNVQQKGNDYNYSDPIAFLGFTSDGKYLIASGSTLDMWDIQTKSIYKDLTKSIPAISHQFYLLDDPKLIFFNESIREMDTPTGEIRSAYSLSIYNIETGKRERIIKKYAYLRSVSQNNRFIVYVDESAFNQSEHDLVVYDLEKDEERFRTTKSNVSYDQIYAVSNSGDFYIYNNQEDKEHIHFFNIKDKRVMHSIETNPIIYPTVVGDILLFPDDSKLLVRKFKKITIYDISDLTSGVKEAEALER